MTNDSVTGSLGGAADARGILRRSAEISWRTMSVGNVKYTGRCLQDKLAIYLLVTIQPSTNLTYAFGDGKIDFLSSGELVQEVGLVDNER